MKFLNALAEGNRYLESFRELYEGSFPPLEKKPFDFMRERAEAGLMSFWAMEEGGEFIGLVITMEAGGRALLDYFAIHPKFQSNGYGGRAIHELLKVLLEKWIERDGSVCKSLSYRL